MKNFWLGEKSISKTFFVIVIPLIIYLYVVTSETFYNNLSKIGIQSLAMEIFLKIFGVILSLFATTIVWRSTEKKIKNFLIKSILRIFILIVFLYSIYQAFIIWIMKLN